MKKVILISSCFMCPHRMYEAPNTSYCMENDDPPFQFVLRPIEGDIGDVPEWCDLPDAPDELEQYFFKPVIPPKDMRRS